MSYCIFFEPKSNFLTYTFNLHKINFEANCSLFIIKPKIILYLSVLWLIYSLKQQNKQQLLCIINLNLFKNVECNLWNMSYPTTIMTSQHLSIA